MPRISKKSRIYIAGHTGLVGSRILKRYQDEGFTNILIKTRSELDLLDQVEVDRFFKVERPEYVILAAAKVGGIMANKTHQADFLYENITIQNNIIWAAHQHGVKKLLFLGSSCIYPRESGQPIKEEYFMTGPLEPTNEGYAIAKIAGMKLCEKISEQYGKNFISIMPCNIYGPGDHFDPENSHVVAATIRKFVEAVEQDLPSVEVWGTGKPKREFLYNEDLADAVFFLMDHYNDRQFVNVGVGNDISIKNLAIRAKRLTGYKGKIVFNTQKPDGMMRKVMDVSKLTALGWTPKTSFEIGLKKTIDWYLKNRSK
jgi:GDP-L-fucose synthase